MEQSARAQMLEAEMLCVKAENVRLEEENMLLRHRLNRASSDKHTNASVNVEAKIKVYQLEEERDHLQDTLQQHKKRYNKLYDAYLSKVQRCKALENTFRMQKTMTGLVMKSALAQRETEQQLLQEKRKTKQGEITNLETLQLKLSKLQAALDESYDIIDEMDFELDSVDLLEMQNKSLRDELAALKLQQMKHHEPPPKYEEGDSSYKFESVLKDNDSDAETLERSALTHSLIETAEAESHCLRRELLRSRWEHASMRKNLDRNNKEQAKNSDS